MTLQTRDFLDDPVVAAASVLRERLAADEEFRCSFSYWIVSDY